MESCRGKYPEYMPILDGFYPPIKEKMRMTPEEFKKFGMNVLKFTAPALALFFGQLSQGVDPKLASGVALLALWGLLADLFSKLNK